MVPREIAVILVGMSLVSVLASAQSPTPDLDFSILQPVIDEQAAALGDEGERTQMPMPLAARLLNVPQSCEWEQPITYDIELQNVSSRNIRLPWSVDSQDRGEAFVEGYPMMSLGLGAASANGQGLMGHETLFGSSLNPQSIRTLQPGQVVVIRGRGTCATTDGEVPAVGSSTTLSIAGHLHVWLNPVSPSALVASSPVVVTVTR